MEGLSLPRRRVMVGIGAAAVVGVTVAAIWLVTRSDPEPAQASGSPWLAKVKTVQNQFPPGYQVSRVGPTNITQEYLDKLRAPLQGAEFIPAECAEQSQSGSSTPVGAKTEGIQGRFNDRMITVAAMESPQPLAARSNLSQCAAVAFVKPGYIHGFVSHVAAPEVPDVVNTQALRMSATVTDASGANTDTVQYAYVTTLDDRHVVSVTITGTPILGRSTDIDPAPAPAQHLLQEAVRALRD
jgi:Domain of unknown function (DUF5642)